MAGIRGKTTQSWMIAKIKNIAIAINDETGMEAHWSDVQQRLNHYMATTVDPATKGDELPLLYARTHKVPERNTIRKFLLNVKYPPNPENGSWSMGMSSVDGLSEIARAIHRVANILQNERRVE